MSVDPTVLAAILATVEAQPDQVALRLHYADLLFQNGQSDACLCEVGIVLARQPDNRTAIELGSKAADAKGDKILATSYRRILTSLGMDQAKNLIENSGMAEPSVQPKPVRQPVEQEYDHGQEESKDDLTLSNGLEFERPEITLKDVKGLQAVKDRLDMAFLGPLRNPELRKLYGKSLKGGLLLYGPPGCGKTYIARAVAGELGAKFLNVGLTDVIDMWLGNSEKNLHEIFQYARRLQPCVLFFDELDAVGRKRSLMRDQAGRTIINQLLNELDGAHSDNEGVFVIGATNHPWDVDSALKRPGRLDRTVLVLPPDLVAREDIARSCLLDRPTKDIDCSWIAKESDGFSAADVNYLIECAAELALSDSIRKGIARPIVMNDVKQAIRQIRPSTRSWLETAKNFAVYANDGGAYDELLGYLRQKKII